MYVTQAKYLEICRNNLQLLAKMYAVTDDKEKISHSNCKRDFLTHCFITL